MAELQTLDIRTVNGMYGAADPRDLSPGFAAYCRDIDIVTEVGAFSPLPADDAKTGTVSGAKSIVQFEDGAKAAYWNGSGISVISNVDSDVLVISSPTVDDNVGSLSATGNQSGSSDGEAVHFGLGGTAATKSLWIGQIAHGQFGGSAPVGVQACAAPLYTDPLSQDVAQSVVENIVTTQAYVRFEEGTKLFYYASLVYDGFQISPPKLIATVELDGLTGTQLGWGSVSFYVRVCTDAGVGDPIEQAVSKRVTAVKVFRGTSVSAQGGIDSDLRLIMELDLTEAGLWAADDDGDNLGKKHIVNDNGADLLRSYEDESGGISYTLDDMVVHYGHSVVADGYHIVADTWQTENLSRPNMLFRSEPYRYDTFDWSRNYLTLPTEPVALAAFLGRVYAFANGKTHIIDPSSFSILDTWEGIGCIHERSVSVNDRGMFFVDNNNIYHHDGSHLNIIGESILRNKYLAGAGWLAADTSYIPTLTYSAKYDSLIVIYRTSAGAATYGLMYHIPSKRWMHLSMPVNGTLGDKIYKSDGTPMVVINSTLYELFGDTTNRSWKFVSHNLNPSLGNQAKFYYARLAVLSGTPSASTLVYYDNDVDYTTGHQWSGVAVDPSNNQVYKGQINQKTGGRWDAVRDFVIELNGSGTEKYDHISITARPNTSR